MRAWLLRLTRTLHFRLTLLFILLASASVAGFYYLLPYTVFSSYDDEVEKTWYKDEAAGQLDSLANELAVLLGDTLRAEELLVAFGKRVEDFEAEVVVFDAEGRHLCSCSPDSLAEAVPLADVVLLRDMSDGEWDFSSYPDSSNLDSYANRIFHVARVVPAAGDDEHPAAYLSASFEPDIYSAEELGADRRALVVQAVVMLLIYATVSALIIMAWTSRRISRLSRGVQFFTDGELAARVPESRSDEIGVLGHNINAMAVRIESMVQELTGKEQFQRQLVANISHDLRTPLAGLRGYLETLGLREDRMTEANRQQFLDNITRKLDHLNSLIDHALVLSRLDSGQDAFRPEDFSLGELGEAVLTRYEMAAEGRGVELDLELEAQLPDVHADPLQIGRVLQNLVENAIKFTPTGGRVELRVRQASGVLEVTVQDSGVGIAPDDLPHIFERFYTGDKSRTPGCAGATGPAASLERSSGLGLAIASRIVNAHDSRLEVESEPGQGSRFRFRLPVATVTDAAGGD